MKNNFLVVDGSAHCCQPPGPPVFYLFGPPDLALRSSPVGCPVFKLSPYFLEIKLRIAFYFFQEFQLMANENAMAQIAKSGNLM